MPLPSSWPALQLPPIAAFRPMSALPNRRFGWKRGVSQPAVAGVYLVVRGSDIVYVGSTSRLRRRVNFHRHYTPWVAPNDEFFWYECNSAQERVYLEALFIGLLRPKFNRNAGGNPQPDTRPTLTAKAFETRRRWMRKQVAE